MTVNLAKHVRALLATLAMVFVIVVVTGVSAGCSGNSAKNHYLLAERLWTDGNYAASVVEFEKASAKDPRGKLGQQALLRGAMTEAYFLSRYGDAIRKFRAFAEASPGTEQAWDAEKQVGEILYVKTEQYDQAILHYQRLMQLKPDAAETPEFLYRVARSRFYLWQFDDALTDYREIIKKYPDTPWAEKAMLEVGETQFTRGEQHPGVHTTGTENYQLAMDAFEKFLKIYPKSELAARARFGIASCFEELDQLDAAYHAYAALKATYPSPKVIEIKLARIRERKAQRSR